MATSEESSHERKHIKYPHIEGLFQDSLHKMDINRGSNEALHDGLPIDPSLSIKKKGSDDRVQSPQKMKYAAEVSLIKKNYGDLEDIRKRLGLSQRKIAQLLMVDPSAWTRWTRETKNTEPPPHIYRALHWFILLQEKDPSAGNPYAWLQTVSRPYIPPSEIKALEAELRERILKTSSSHMSLEQKKIKTLLVLHFALLGIFFFLGIFVFLRP